MITAEEVFAPQEVPTRPRSMRDKFFKRRHKEQQKWEREKSGQNGQQKNGEQPHGHENGRQVDVAPRKQPEPAARQDETAPLGSPPPQECENVAAAAGANGQAPQHVAENARLGLFPPVDSIYPNDHGMDILDRLSSQFSRKSQRELDLETFELQRQGMSYRQIAHRCDVSVSTAYARARRGEHYASNPWLTMTETEQLATDISRLEQIQRVLLPQAYNGDLHIAVVVLNIMRFRHSLAAKRKQEVRGGEVIAGLGEGVASLLAPDRPPSLEQRSATIAARSTQDELDADELAAYSAHFKGVLDTEASHNQPPAATTEATSANPSDGAAPSHGNPNAGRTRSADLMPARNGVSPSAATANGLSASDATPSTVRAEKNNETPNSGENHKGGQCTHHAPLDEFEHRLP